MKRLFLIAMFVAFAIPTTSQADLVAGWDVWNLINLDGTTNARLTAGATGIATKGTGITWNQEFRAGSSDGTFGNNLIGADPTVGLAAASHFTGTRSPSTAAPVYDFTVTDSSGVARDLDQFHFDAIRRGGSGSVYSLEILSGGALSAGFVVGDGTFAGGVTHVSSFDVENNQGNDVSLAGLGDRTLDALGSVTFRLSFVQGTGANHLDLDNVGVSSVSAVPEPTSLALIAFGSVGMLLRRKK